MRRRRFIAGLGSAAAWPVVAGAQQQAVPVIGWLSAVPGTMERDLPLFSQGLAETGYVVGRNVTIDASGDHVGQQAAIAACSPACRCDSRRGTKCAACREARHRPSRLLS